MFSIHSLGMGISSQGMSEGKLQPTTGFGSLCYPRSRTTSKSRTWNLLGFLRLPDLFIPTACFSVQSNISVPQRRAAFPIVSFYPCSQHGTSPTHLLIATHEAPCRLWWGKSSYAALLKRGWCDAETRARAGWYLCIRCTSQPQGLPVASGE